MLNTKTMWNYIKQNGFFWQIQTSALFISTQNQTMFLDLHENHKTTTEQNLIFKIRGPKKDCLFLSDYFVSLK